MINFKNRIEIHCFVLTAKWIFKTLQLEVSAWQKFQKLICCNNAFLKLIIGHWDVNLKPNTILMFIINLTYKVPLEKVDQFLNQHNEYLDKQYELENFLASGRKVPRTGGIILSKIHNKSEVEKIIEKDPFKINDLADYELIEFIPGKAAEEMKFLME